MAVVLSMGLAACGGGDDETPGEAPETPETPVVPETPFSVQLYSFEKGIGGNIKLVDTSLTWEYNETTGRDRVTNADASVYKSIEYETYPRLGQAAQGIKLIVVELADEYPATTEQLVDYLQVRHVQLSSENGVWTFSDTANPDNQRYQLTFTAAKRQLQYLYVNEPAFTDFSGYMGKDIKTVGWGNVDATGNFLEYSPYGGLDGMINSVSMSADWAYNDAGQRLDWKAVNLITVEFTVDMDNEKVVLVGQDLRRRYGEPVSYDSTKYFFSVETYHDKEHNLIITLRGQTDRQQKVRSRTVTGTVWQVVYSPLK